MQPPDIQTNLEMCAVIWVLARLQCNDSFQYLNCCSKIVNMLILLITDSTSLEALKSVNSSNGPDADGVPSSVLRKCSDTLFLLYNQSLLEYHWPMFKSESRSLRIIVVLLSIKLFLSSLKNWFVILCTDTLLMRTKLYSRISYNYWLWKAAREYSLYKWSN